MFKRISKSFCELAFLFALTFSVQSQAFELRSSDLFNKTDYFTQLKRDPQFRVFSGFVNLCREGQHEKCLELSEGYYSQKKYKAFRNLIAELSVKAQTQAGLPLSRLDFLSKSELKEGQLRVIIQNNTEKDLQFFFPKSFFEQDQHMGSLILKKPNLLCHFKFNREFVEKSLIRISEQEVFYKLNFSSFPCDLPLKGEYLILEREKKEAQKFKLKEYRFQFLQDQVSRYYYKKFRHHKRGSLKTRIKKSWAKLTDYPDFVQKRLVSNLFYRSYYKVLMGVKTLSPQERHKISPHAWAYVLKAFASQADYDSILNLSQGFSFERAKWAEEILLLRAISYMRKGDFVNSSKELHKMLDVCVDLRLSALYWLWYSSSQLKDEAEKKRARDQILESYPFSYYGIVVASEKNKKSFLKYLDWTHFKSSFKSTLTDEERLRLKFYYSYSYFEDFKKTYFSIVDKLEPKQKALFALVFLNLGEQIEVIRNLNTTWDELPSSRREPFLSASFPRRHRKEISSALKKTTSMSFENIWAIMRQESAFNSEAKSPAGARGLMQVIPATGREVARQLGLKSYKGSSSLYKPAVNVQIGAKYMDRLIAASRGYLPYAYASYNAGPGRMYKWSAQRFDLQALRQDFRSSGYDPINELWVEELPWSETRFYVKALLRNQGIYKSLQRKEKAFKCWPFWWCD